MLNSIYNKLLEEVHGDDMDSQMHYLGIVAELRQLPIQYLLDFGILFIPNNDYIKHYIGDDPRLYSTGLYSGDRCNWNLYVTIPVRDLTGKIVGLTGWDMYGKLQEGSGGERLESAYKVSSRDVFDRHKYPLTDVNLLRFAFDKRIVCVTDGVFDTLSLCSRGIPSMALLGSTYSPELLYMFRWFRKVFVCADNDEAGTSLYKHLTRSLPNVCRVTQSLGKDIDDYLKLSDLSLSELSELSTPIGKEVRLTSRRFHASR